MFDRSSSGLPELYVPEWDCEVDDGEDIFGSLLEVLHDPQEQAKHEREAELEQELFPTWENTDFYSPVKSETAYAHAYPVNFTRVTSKHGHETDFDLHVTSEVKPMENSTFTKRGLCHVQNVSTSRSKKCKFAYDSNPFPVMPSTDARFNEYYVKAATKKFIVQDKSKTGVDIYLCPFPGCSSKYRSEVGLRTHMENHAKGGTRYFECTQCNEGFYSSGCLKSHKITHVRKTGEYVCAEETCGKRYSTAEGLRLHTRNHHQINKNWKCMAEGCDSCFVRQADLRMHLIRMHCDERPYPCEHKGCRKAFACHSELRRHMEISHKVKIKGGVKTRPPTKAIQNLLHKAHVYFKEKRKKMRERKAARGK